MCQPGGGYGGNHDRLVDLRVDHDNDPITRLVQLLAVRDYYFDRAPPQEWVPLDAPLMNEMFARLSRNGWMEPGQPLDQALMGYLGWENLEERWTDSDTIDPVALVHLRQHLPR